MSKKARALQRSRAETGARVQEGRVGRHERGRGRRERAAPPCPTAQPVLSRREAAVARMRAVARAVRRRRVERAAEVVEARGVLARAEDEAHHEQDALHGACDGVRDPRCREPRLA